MTNSSQRKIYWARVNKAIDFIEHNISSPLSLKEIAYKANFSPYHFHRIFSALVGETLNAFIQRIRLEKAANQLLANPGKPITDIAFDCGFSGSAAFARSFKEKYTMSASQWRDGGCNEFRKNCKTQSNYGKSIRKNQKEIDSSIEYITTVYNENGAVSYTINQRRDTMSIPKEISVTVETLPDMNVAYIRHIGPYAGDSKLFKGLFEKLFKWAGPRGLLGSKDLKVLSVYHDNPEVTDESKLRTSVCITVPEGTLVNGDVGTMVVPGGKYAMGHFELSASEYGEAWNALCGDWLPDSGYQPDDRPCFEWCKNNPEEHPQNLHIVDICVPVKPL